MSYADLLKDPRWQKKRLEVLESNGWACEACGSATKTLHVHHPKYKNGSMPWEYEKDELEVLCEDCHAEITLLTKDLKEQISTLNISLLFRLRAYAGSLAVVHGESTKPVHSRWEDEWEGISDAFSRSQSWFPISPLDVRDRSVNDHVDVCALAKEESDAMDVELEKSMARGRINRG
jgi:hypothetical protein